MSDQRPRWALLRPQARCVSNLYHNAQPSPELNGSASVVWAHHVSRNLARWATMPVPLCDDSPYDVGGLPTGSATVLDDGQVRIVYPGGCDCSFPSCKWSCQVHSGSGTGPKGNHGGSSHAVAEPVNASDPLLTRWSKPSYNPVFPQSTKHDDANQAYADSSGAWKTAHGEWRFVGVNPTTPSPRLDPPARTSKAATCSRCSAAKTASARSS